VHIPAVKSTLKGVTAPLLAAPIGRLAYAVFITIHPMTMMRQIDRDGWEKKRLNE
jgi:hypothetical protein